VIKPLLVAALGVAIVLGARAWLSTPGATPAGQPTLVVVTDLETLKSEFNREAAKPRAIIILSASCPYCLKGATAIERILATYRELPLVAFVVWQPILATDWGQPGTGALHRLADARVRQFWDADHHVAGAFKTSFEGRDDQPQCCYQDGIWWDLMAAFPPGGEWRDRLPEPALLGGTVEDVAGQFDALLAKLSRTR